MKNNTEPPQIEIVRFPKINGCLQDLNDQNTKGFDGNGLAYPSNDLARRNKKDQQEINNATSASSSMPIQSSKPVIKQKKEQEKLSDLNSPKVPKQEMSSPMDGSPGQRFTKDYYGKGDHDEMQQTREEATKGGKNSNYYDRNDSTQPKYWTAGTAVASSPPQSYPKFTQYLLKMDRKVLTVLNLSTKECPYCLQGGAKSLMHLISQNLDKKYLTSRDYYNIKVINDIIYNENAHIVSIFKDYLIFDDVSEFLKRFYQNNESTSRLPKIFEFYEKYSKVFPNYVVLPESKYMFKNIERKQRVIDDKQRLMMENHNKVKQKPTKTNNVGPHSELQASIHSDNKMFSSKFMESILKIKPFMPVEESMRRDIENSKNMIPLMDNFLSKDSKLSYRFGEESKAEHQMSLLQDQSFLQKGSIGDSNHPKFFNISQFEETYGKPQLADRYARGLATQYQPPQAQPSKYGQAALASPQKPIPSPQTAHSFKRVPKSPNQDSQNQGRFNPVLGDNPRLQQLSERNLTRGNDRRGVEAISPPLKMQQKNLDDITPKQILTHQHQNQRILQSKNEERKFIAQPPQNNQMSNQNPRQYRYALSGTTLEQQPSSRQQMPSPQQQRMAPQPQPHIQYQQQMSGDQVSAVSGGTPSKNTIFRTSENRDITTNSHSRRGVFEYQHHAEIPYRADHQQHLIQGTQYPQQPPLSGHHERGSNSSMTSGGITVSSRGGVPQEPNFNNVIRSDEYNTMAKAQLSSQNMQHISATSASGSVQSKQLGRVSSQPELHTDRITKAQAPLASELIVSPKKRIKNNRTKSYGKQQYQAVGRYPEKQILGVEEKANAQMNKYLRMQHTARLHNTPGLTSMASQGQIPTNTGAYLSGTGIKNARHHRVISQANVSKKIPMAGQGSAGRYSQQSNYGSQTKLNPSPYQQVYATSRPNFNIQQPPPQGYVTQNGLAYESQFQSQRQGGYGQNLNPHEMLGKVGKTGSMSSRKSGRDLSGSSKIEHSFKGNQMNYDQAFNSTGSYAQQKMPSHQYTRSQVTFGNEHQYQTIQQFNPSNKLDPSKNGYYANRNQGPHGMIGQSSSQKNIGMGQGKYQFHQFPTVTLDIPTAAKTSRGHYQTNTITGPAGGSNGQNKSLGGKVRRQVLGQASNLKQMERKGPSVGAGSGASTSRKGNLGVHHGAFVFK